MVVRPQRRQPFTKNGGAQKGRPDLVHTWRVSRLSGKKGRYWGVEDLEPLRRRGGGLELEVEKSKESLVLSRGGGPFPNDRLEGEKKPPPPPPNQNTDVLSAEASLKKGGGGEKQQPLWCEE